LSSLSNEWVEIASRAERFQESEDAWDKTVNVEVTTLDSLIARFGVPHFIKIDVEGFELQALRCLSRMPSVLSFEFNREWLTPTMECLQQPCFPSHAKFNYVAEDRSRLALATWIEAGEMAHVLQSQMNCKYGDVFASV
jgi:hypothetical protein